MRCFRTTLTPSESSVKYSIGTKGALSSMAGITPSIPVNTSIDIDLTPEPNPIRHGLLVYLGATVSGATTGTFSVRVFSDSDRTILIHEIHCDLLVPESLSSNDSRRYIVDTTTGVLYFSVFNSTNTPIIVTLAAELAVLIAGTPSYTDPSPVGKGLEPDGTGATQVALGAGLEFDGNSVRIKENALAEVPIRVLASGLSADNAVPISGSETDLTTLINFTDNLTIKTNPVSVPPATAALGKYKEGSFFRTSNGLLWECIDDTYTGLRWRALSNGTFSYEKTVSVLANSSTEAAVTGLGGRRGSITKIKISGFHPTYSNWEYDDSFRFGVFPNSSFLERDRIFQIVGQHRATYTVASVAAGDILPVSSVTGFDIGSLIALKRFGIADLEYQRVEARDVTTLELNINDSIDSALGVGSNVSTVTEITGQVWANDDDGAADSFYFKLWNQSNYDKVFIVQLDLEISGYDA